MHNDVYRYTLSAVSHTGRASDVALQYVKCYAKASCCTLRPRTTPFLWETSMPGVVHGVSLWADMNAATPPGQRCRAAVREMDSSELPRVERLVENRCGSKRTVQVHDGVRLPRV